MMKQIVLNKFGIANLTLQSVPKPAIGTGDILVRMKAASLNYVDLALVEGTLNPDLPLPIYPVADGAGIVEEIGPGVTGFKAGDLVSTVYIPPWKAGRYRHEFTSLEIRPGTNGVPGQLSEYKIFQAHEIIQAPRHLSAEEASTLPVAAVTAWNALAYGNLKPGDSVLIHGTGGVGIFALQFARLFGAKIIITSGDDEKLATAGSLGADFGINYKKTPDIAHEVLRITNNEGVNLVVETVGGDNLNLSISCLKTQGLISLVGFLAGISANINIIDLNMKRATITGVSVGSTQDFEDMLLAITLHKIKPIISATFPLEKASEAFHFLKNGSHLGKVVIQI